MSNIHLDIVHFFATIVNEVKSMELYEEIILHALRNERAIISVSFPDMKLNAQELVGAASYGALIGIQHILKDDTLNDEECFYKIEEIVRIFENMGSGCCNRHDFG